MGSSVYLHRSCEPVGFSYSYSSLSGLAGLFPPGGIRKVFSDSQQLTID